MTWTEQAAQSLTEVLGDWFSTDGVTAATAAIDASGTVVITSPADTPAHARFEIGSVTKTMTATVLSSLAADGMLALDDPIDRWLSAGAHGEITIRELATHTSGLPAVAPNRLERQANPANPWAGYTFELAEEGLRQATVTPGKPWRYSNLGYQLLGLIVQRASGQEYSVLMTERLLDPLGMTYSGVGRRGEGTLLTGHADGRQIAQWDHPWGAGGVEATIADMARYAQACLFPPKTPLGAAIRLTQAPVLRVAGDVEQGLAWAVHHGSVCEHSGVSGGFSACITTDQGRGRAVVTLVSYGGSLAVSTRLKQASQLVLAGGDPRQASEPVPWPTWREDAREVVLAMQAGHVAQVHARLVPQRRERVTVQQLGRAWAKIVPHAVQQLRAPQQPDIAIVRHEIAASGAVIADIAVTTADGSPRLRMVIMPNGDLAGFTPVPAE
jgi:CubicO group peptidase (beta-lactamase class C family)